MVILSRWLKGGGGVGQDILHPAIDSEFPFGDQLDAGKSPLTSHGQKGETLATALGS